MPPFVDRAIDLSPVLPEHSRSQEFCFEEEHLILAMTASHEGFASRNRLAVGQPVNPIRFHFPVSSRFHNLPLLVYEQSILFSNGWHRTRSPMVGRVGCIDGSDCMNRTRFYRVDLSNSSVERSLLSR